MRAIGSFVKRHPLWLGLAATLVPLLVLLGLQYQWLARLERMTALAHEAALDKALEAIGSDVEYSYRSTAERVLNIPGWFLENGQASEVATVWGKEAPAGARSLFLVDFTQAEFGKYWRYDPQARQLVPLEGDPTGLAVILASTPWQLFRVRGVPVQRPVLEVDERDPDNRMILNPIIDGSGSVLGVAGMVVDESYLREVLLPETIDGALTKFFPGVPRDDLRVGVRDASGVPVFERGTLRQGNHVKRRLPFVFTDWRLELQSAPSGPARWARTSFVFNMALGALLAGVLAGGVALALRTANRAMRLSTMKSDFVSNVSHELRTPLASIRVFAEFLKLGRVQSPEQVREYGDYIETESQRLTRLIDNILDFARIESGRKTYHFVDTDLRDVVEPVVHSFAVRLEHEGFELDFVPPARPLPAVAVDRDAIGQALHNLLDNAIKYSGDVRRIGVTLGREGNEIVLAVQDHGIGIASAEQRKIFDRFHRAGSTLVHDVKGAGLGLSIVQHIVHAHRGQVTVESEPQRGSTFRIHLPVSASATPPGAALGQPAPERRPTEETA